MLGLFKKDTVFETKMSRLAKIETILKDQFQPTQLEVVDFTQSHVGHKGQGGGMETHVRITIQSKEFEDCSLLTAHRKIQNAVKDEFEDGLHALEIKVI